jgi:hypothetical protein
MNARALSLIGAGAPSRRGGRVPAMLPHLLFVAALWLGLGWIAAPAQAADLPTYTVTAKDGRLSPTEIEVPVGQRIKLIVKNEGPGPIEFENLDLRIEKVLAPGGTSFIVTPKLRPGKHEFFDEFHADTGRMWLIAK